MQTNSFETIPVQLIKRPCPFEFLGYNNFESSLFFERNSMNEELTNAITVNVLPTQELEPTTPGENYFKTIADLLGVGADGKSRALFSLDKPSGSGYIPIRLNFPANQGGSVFILRHVTHRYSGDISAQDTVNVKGDTQNTELNFELNSARVFRMAPKGDTAHFQQMISLFQEASITPGAIISCNNSNLLISDGKQWVPFTDETKLSITSGASQLGSGE